ncbi:MAG: Rpn family recombination-promoting nuclease/putative transposase, partial [Myxococcaceae bacterium]
MPPSAVCFHPSRLRSLLFEHQSGVDAMMPFRLLCYVTRVWERWLKENPKARRLPPVVS